MVRVPGELLRTLIASIVVTGAVGCAGPYVDRGTTLYEHGRYIEAAEVFERTEGLLAESTDRERAQYGLYRGLTFVRLGDLEHARLWLSYAYQVERSAPGTLDPAELGAIQRVWAEVEAAGAPASGWGAVATARVVPAAGQEPNGQRSVESADSFDSDEL